MTRKYFVLIGIFVFIYFLILTPIQAQNRPIQISLFNPVQIFSEDDSITGVRLNLIYGRNVSITGLYLGLINHTTTGISTGVQWGLVGLADSDFIGWQDNVVNWTKGNFNGFQLGIVNRAAHMTGFQLGIVNYDMSAEGLQIGVVNIIRDGGMFPFFPIVNWSF